ncbi:hypothetical protein [Halomontanus rarus]|uniref:hypothetical protein n=1 Tax=Halomontanus rarus TaxID=3034020 RepID=UPI00293BB742|nr:hypothetical protein [Halovivax sp. KZCA124]
MSKPDAGRDSNQDHEFDPRASHQGIFLPDYGGTQRLDIQVVDHNSDPEGENVVSQETAHVEDGGDHRFVFLTLLAERSHKHDRYYSIAYEATTGNGGG